jgi:hypothetical protein
VNRISIRQSDGAKFGAAIIEIDGVDVANSVLNATLRLRPGDVARLEMEFLGLHDVTEIGGVAEWLAYANGQTAHGSDIPTVLRELAAKIEAARVPA